MQNNTTATIQTFSTKSWLEKYGPAVVRFLSQGNLQSKNVAVKVMRQSSQGLVAGMTVDHKNAVVKAFDPEHVASDAAFQRELGTASFASSTGLVPKVLGFDRKAGYIVYEKIEGQPLSVCATLANVVELARELGSWHDTFAMASPSEQHSTTWYDYLSKYEDMRADIEQQPAKSILKSLRIRKLVIGKNDAHLSNYILSTDGALFGIDFEASSMKPAGWEILLLARVLLKQYPEQFDEILPSLLSECGTLAAPLEPQQFQWLARFFALATAFKPLSNQTRRAEIYLERYNGRRPDGMPEARAAIFSPFKGAELVDLKVSERKAFSDHLVAQAKELKAHPVEPEEQTTNERSAPNAYLSAFCTACQGHCCRQGAERGAYIKPETLARVAAETGQDDLSELVADYLRRLPKKHVQNSCLFHGADGCALPRDMRSQTCNRFVCSGGRNLEHQSQKLEQTGGEVLFIADQTDGPANVIRLSGGELFKVPIDTILD